MSSIRKDFNKVPLFLAVSVASLLGFFWKMSPIVGSSFGFFSMSDVVMPLTGALSFTLSLCVAAARSGLTFWYLASPVKALVYHIPGLAASAAWARPSWAVRIALPALCMILFIAHPIGRYAMPYTFYWLIPMAIHLVGRRSIFLQALASTFIAHAVGSVIWLYCKQIPVVIWWDLIPVVAAERLFNALVMTVAYYGIVCLSGYTRKLYARYQARIIKV